MKPVTFVVITVVAFLSTAAVGAEWQGREVVENGAPVVKNPETPIEELTIDLKEAWRRGAEEDDIFFGLPSQVEEDAVGEVYVLDSQVSEILVFSADGENLRTIGREGEGPGEFRGSGGMFIRADGVVGVVMIFPGKVVQLTTEGDPAGVFKLPGAGEGFQLVFRAQSAGDRVVMCRGVQTRGGGASMVQESHLEALDYEGNKLAHFHTMEEKTQYGGMEFDEKVFSAFKFQWAAAPDGRVAAAVTFDDYRIHVWNPDGSLAHVIERPDYSPLERTAQQKERFQKLYDGITSWNPNSTFTISPTHAAVTQVFYRADGSLWALSGRGAWAPGEGVFATFDVYDTDGRFARRVRLKGDGDAAEDGIYFGRERLYLVTQQFSAYMANLGGDVESGEDEGSDEPLQLVAYDIDLPELGASE